MSSQKFATPAERKAYISGYEHGKEEAFKKAILMLQLLSSNTDSFKDSVLQNSPEAVELRKIMTGGNE